MPNQVITASEANVILLISGRWTSLLISYRNFPDSYSLLLSLLWKLMASPSLCSIQTSFSVLCLTPSFHSPFLVIPSLLLGRNIILKYNASLHFNSPTQTLLDLCCPDAGSPLTDPPSTNPHPHTLLSIPKYGISPFP